MRPFALFALLGLLACKGGDDDDDGPPADSGVPDMGDTSVCETWVVDFALESAFFDIRNTPFGAGDTTQPVGPGMLRLGFVDDNGDIGNGPVRMLEYKIELEFTTERMITTDITMESGPNECGVADGTFDGAQITWSTPVRGYHSFGAITCNADEIVCGFANLPMGMPSPRDATTEQAMMPFIFTSSTSTVIPPNGFIMDYVEIPTEEAAETFLKFNGRETARICVRAPECP